MCFPMHRFYNFKNYIRKRKSHRLVNYIKRTHVISNESTVNSHQKIITGSFLLHSAMADAFVLRNLVALHLAFRVHTRVFKSSDTITPRPWDGETRIPDTELQSSHGILRRSWSLRLLYVACVWRQWLHSSHAGAVRPVCGPRGGLFTRSVATVPQYY